MGRTRIAGAGSEPVHFSIAEAESASEAKGVEAPERKPTASEEAQALLERFADASDRGRKARRSLASALASHDVGQTKSYKAFVDENPKWKRCLVATEGPRSLDAVYQRAMAGIEASRQRAASADSSMRSILSELAPLLPSLTIAERQSVGAALVGALVKDPGARPLLEELVTKGAGGAGPLRFLFGDAPRSPELLAGAAKGLVLAALLGSPSAQGAYVDLLARIVPSGDRTALGNLFMAMSRVGSAEAAAAFHAAVGSLGADPTSRAIASAATSIRTGIAQVAAFDGVAHGLEKLGTLGELMDGVEIAGKLGPQRLKEVASQVGSHAVLARMTSVASVLADVYELHKGGIDQSDTAYAAKAMSTLSSVLALAPDPTGVTKLIALGLKLGSWLAEAVETPKVAEEMRENGFLAKDCRPTIATQIVDLLHR